ncbi:MAG: MaoC family dehydratase [Candidatus Eremiobacteraeota bacterium]|nr:MaoC family dehydratase [Candidatus Eremiobacteraeota bacterium]
MKPFEAFKVGDRATFTKTIGEADILLFAAISGDNYSVHVDEEYAKTTRFGGRIAHGMLTASMLSATNGMLLQQPGGISVAQTLRFLKPVYPGDTITARSEVVEILVEKRRLRCRTWCTNQRGEIVIEGEAIEQKDVH